MYFLCKANLQKIHKTVDRLRYLAMNLWITADDLNLSSYTCRNAVNSPAGYFLLLESAIWKDTHRSRTSLASWSLVDFGIVNLLAPLATAAPVYIERPADRADHTITRHHVGMPFLR